MTNKTLPGPFLPYIPDAKYILSQNIPNILTVCDVIMVAIRKVQEKENSTKPLHQLSNCLHCSLSSPYFF